MNSNSKDQLFSLVKIFKIFIYNPQRPDRRISHNHAMNLEVPAEIFHPVRILEDLATILKYMIL